MNLQSFKKFEPCFAPRFKFPVHLAELVLAIVVVALSGARMTMKGTTRGRGSTMGLGMGVKSIVIILYQLLTEHVPSLKRWASLKAFAVLNCLEFVFWGAVAFLVLRGNIQQCEGTSCALGWVIVALAMVLNFLAQYVAVITVLDYLHFRKNQARRGDKVAPSVDQESLSNVGNSRT